ncbi:MAG: D-2-hydroxyacid dehydrogenase [Flavobacteriaceae bacterium]|tara:strand:- start:8207 stop:9160 length:954 start_codon:yes stop_codon:yes gene_type:complete
MKVLANDGISENAVDILNKNSFDVYLDKVEQSNLIDFINLNKISVLLVRSATQVRKNLIDNCQSLKIIGRGGVGMDNIDVEYAKSKGILVINTPGASSNSVAELVFAHLFSGSRFLFDSNRNMPLEGEKKFKILKKKYSEGIELKNKNLGIIGLGKIGREVARIGFGLGMNVHGFDKFIKGKKIKVKLNDQNAYTFEINLISFEEILKKSDFISLHVPAQKNFLIGKNEFEKMKKGSAIINASRGGIIDEEELIRNLDNGKIKFAGLDTFENEPTPSVSILMHPKISLTPHIGAATSEAQERIGEELAKQICDFYKI